MSDPEEIQPSKSPLRELAALFGRLGAVAFGGPAAHIAMMEDEVVTRGRWMSRQHFLDLIGATNLVPGPNSTEMTMHVGFERAGWRGLLVAGSCFILPAATLTALFAWFYVTWGTLPQVEPALAGIRAVVVAVILGALAKLGRKAVKSVRLGVLGASVLVALVYGWDEVLALLVGGLVGGLWLAFSSPAATSGQVPGTGSEPSEQVSGTNSSATSGMVPGTAEANSESAEQVPGTGSEQVPGTDSEPSEQVSGTNSGTDSESAEQVPGTAEQVPGTVEDDLDEQEAGDRRSISPAALALGAAGTGATASAVSLTQLGLFFLKVGAVLYGSGYVLVAFLEGDLVQQRGWLTEGQLLDAIAVGQLTPGPVLTTATFIGFLLLGPQGAVVATLAIFLPSFVFVALLNPIVPKLRRHRLTAAFLDAVNVSAVALMAAVTADLARASLTSGPAWILTAVAAVALVRFRVNAAWLVLLGGVVGWLVPM